ncbi:thiamine transporter 2 isoform X4 [Pieris rapae]|uniref:thiamine transporter 2 isoform X4 n=1 Tax=Pieris rapae TaxID=64459 RepID=UPI001E27E2E7|nr:thiamine transporter 2 isoform X4 [Pieris rapae]
MEFTWQQKWHTSHTFMRRWTLQSTLKSHPTLGWPHLLVVFSLDSNSGNVLGVLAASSPIWNIFSSAVNCQYYAIGYTDRKTTTTKRKSYRSQIFDATVLIYRHARSAYSRPKVVAWSALYAVALALFVQSQTYIQLLWKRIRVGDEEIVLYNGAVEALQTAFGAAGAFLAPYWTYAVLPAPIAAVQGVAMFLATYVNDISTSYTGYIVMGMLFHYTITLASAKIASQLSDESCFGLIFGINTVIGTGLQSILTLVLIQTLDLPIQAQYYFISGFFLLLASLWLLGCTIYFFKQKHSINLNQY